MDNPWQKGDDAKNNFIKKTLDASADAASGSKVSDLFDKNSPVYKNQNPEPKKEVVAPKEIPTTDTEGYPIIGKVHTYKDDFINTVKGESMSMSRIAMMEQKAAKGLEKNTDIKWYKKNPILLWGSIFGGLIVIGIVGGVIMNTVQNSQTEATPVAVVEKPKDIIYTEQKRVLNISNSTKTEIEGKIQSAIASFKEEDSMMEIIPSYGEGSDAILASTADLFRVTKGRLSDTLLRSMPDRFVLGLYSKKGRTDPFLLLYTSSYDTAYPGLLEWEGFMRDDLSWLFNTNVKNPDGSLIPLSFKDRIIYSKDARSLEDGSGKNVFFYTFIDQNTILFARTTDTLTEMINRLREAKFK